MKVDFESNGEYIVKQLYQHKCASHKEMFYRFSAKLFIPPSQLLSFITKKKFYILSDFIFSQNELGNKHFSSRTTP